MLFNGILAVPIHLDGIQDDKSSKLPFHCRCGTKRQFSKAQIHVHPNYIQFPPACFNLLHLQVYYRRIIFLTMLWDHHFLWNHLNNSCGVNYLQALHLVHPRANLNDLQALHLVHPRANLNELQALHLVHRHASLNELQALHLVHRHANLNELQALHLVHPRASAVHRKVHQLLLHPWNAPTVLGRGPTVLSSSAACKASQTT